MKHRILFLIGLLFFVLVKVSLAQNLVPNYSFEDTISHNGVCIGPIEWALHWFSPTAGTPDLYTFSPGSSNCMVSSLNNPNGYQLARTGINYSGFYTYPGTREYPTIKLDSTLSNGCIYYIEFFVSRANSYGLATDKIGCAFTNDTTGYYITSMALPIIPAILSPAGFLITDSLNWTKISGNYTANGTEKYLLIGNFFNDINTYADTASTSLYYSAYYYLDDVKVLSCDSTLAMGSFIHTEDKEPISIYPNPAKDFLNVFYYGNDKINCAEFYDLSGRLLSRHKLLNAKLNTISLNPLTSGSYLLKISFYSSEKYYSRIFIAN